MNALQVFAVTCREEWAADFHEAGRGVVWDIQVSPDDSQVCIAVGKQLCLRSLRDMQTIVNFQTEDAAVLSCVWDETGHKVMHLNKKISEKVLSLLLGNDRVGFRRCQEEEHLCLHSTFLRPQRLVFQQINPFS